jgi:hypothetical protein
VKLPKHNCGLYLAHNAYRDIYQSIAQAVENLEDCYTWSAEEKKNALETEELWTLQWYPDTPVGFYAVAASSLEKLLEAAHNTEQGLA